MAKIPAAGARSTAPAAAAAPQTDAAAPVAGEKKKRKAAPRAKRAAYPGLLVDGKETKLTAIPTDHDPKVHHKLIKSHFVDESMWYEMKAQQLEVLAAKMRAEGQTVKLTGKVKDPNAKKLIALQKKMADLRATLAGQGIDVEALLKDLPVAAAASEGSEEAAAS